MSNTKEESVPTSDGGESQTSGDITMDLSPVLVELEKMIVELVELGKEMVEWSNANQESFDGASSSTASEEIVTADATVSGFI